MYIYSYIIVTYMLFNQMFRGEFGGKLPSLSPPPPPTGWNPAGQMLPIRTKSS